MAEKSVIFTNKELETEANYGLESSTKYQSSQRIFCN